MYFKLLLLQEDKVHLLCFTFSDTFLQRWKSALNIKSMSAAFLVILHHVWHPSWLICFLCSGSGFVLYQQAYLAHICSAVNDGTNCQGSLQGRRQAGNLHGALPKVCMTACSGPDEFWQRATLKPARSSEKHAVKSASWQLQAFGFSICVCCTCLSVCLFSLVSCTGKPDCGGVQGSSYSACPSSLLSCLLCPFLSFCDWTEI